jgi:ubiquinone/menaquinone biosynthesis C-methylase UbiE
MSTRTKKQTSSDKSKSHTGLKSKQKLIKQATRLSSSKPRLAKATDPSDKNLKTEGYLHGYTAKEQNRLYHQARFLEDQVFSNVDFTGRKHIIEIGCGVGAQTEILLERYPDLKITCVDASADQLSRARKHLSEYIKAGRVSLTQANASELPFADDSFDGAFVTWFLEHVPSPIEILKEARRVLQRNALIHLNEVLNHTFFVHPYSPATLQYWFAFNDHQWNLKGDPYVGAKLGNYLAAAGYAHITTNFTYVHLDNRQPKTRARFIEYWIDLLLSGAPELEHAGKVTHDIVQQMTIELSSLRDNPDSVIFFGHMKARAEVL